MKKDGLWCLWRAQPLWKQALLFCVAAILGAAVLFQMQRLDYHRIDGMQDSLNPTQALQQYLQQNPKVELGDVATGNTAFAGERYTTDDFTLYDTQYHLTVNYTYEGEPTGAVLTLWDENALAKDNTAPAAFFTQRLEPGVNKQLVLPLTMDRIGFSTVLTLSAPAGGALSVNDLRLQTVRPYFSDAYGKLLLILLALGAAAWLCANGGQLGQRSKAAGVCLCFLMAVAASLPLLQRGLGLSHDMLFHMGRIESVFLALRSGQIPMVLSPYAHSGFGYADPVYYPNLFLYVPGLLRLVRFSPMLAYKAMFFAVNFLTLLLSYAAAFLCTRSRKAALVFAGIYGFALYRLANVFTRGALGEALAMAFLPLALYGLHNIFWQEKKQWWWLALGMAGVVYSHLLSLMLTALFFALYCVVFIRRLWQKGVLVSLAKAVGFTAGLCAAWLVPFVVWRQYPMNVNYGVPADMTALAVNPTQMFAAFSLSATGVDKGADVSTYGEMPVSLGLLLGVGVLLYLLVRYGLERALFAAHDGLRALGNFCLLGTLTALFASSALFPYTLVSKLGKLNILKFIQFPWRFLGMATLLASVLTALALLLLLRRVPKTARPAGAAALVLLSFLACTPYLDAYVNATPERFYENSSTRIPFNSDTLYLNGAAIAPQEVKTLSCEEKSVRFSECGRAPLKVWFAFENPTGKAQTIRVPLYGYPNAVAKTQDGTRLETGTDKRAQYLVQIPEGLQRGFVIAGFETPFYFYAAYAVSACTAAGGAAQAVWRRTKKQPRKKNEKQLTTPARAGEK